MNIADAGLTFEEQQEQAEYFLKKLTIPVKRLNRKELEKEVAEFLKKPQCLSLATVNPDGTPFDPDRDDPYQPASTVSGLLVEPPRFGSSVDRYPERPVVSMEKVSIKNSFGYGLILWRELTFEFVVHRPEVG